MCCQAQNKSYGQKKSVYLSWVSFNSKEKGWNFLKCVNLKRIPFLTSLENGVLFDNLHVKRVPKIRDLCRKGAYFGNVQKRERGVLFERKSALGNKEKI